MAIRLRMIKITSNVKPPQFQEIHRISRCRSLTTLLDPSLEDTSQAVIRSWFQGRGGNNRLWVEGWWWMERRRWKSRICWWKLVVVSDKVIALRRTVIVARRKMWTFGAKFDDVIAIARTGIYKLLRSMGLRVEGLRVLQTPVAAMGRNWNGRWRCLYFSRYLLLLFDVSECGKGQVSTINSKLLLMCAIGALVKCVFIFS